MRTYLTSIQHENLTPYVFAKSSSQMTPIRLFQGLCIKLDVKIWGYTTLWTLFLHIPLQISSSTTLNSSFVSIDSLKQPPNVNTPNTTLSFYQFKHMVGISSPSYYLHGNAGSPQRQPNIAHQPFQFPIKKCNQWRNTLFSHKTNTSQWYQGHVEG